MVVQRHYVSTGMSATVRKFCVVSVPSPNRLDVHCWRGGVVVLMWWLCGVEPTCQVFDGMACGGLGATILEWHMSAADEISAHMPHLKFIQG
eukprot:3940466-Rhodomonas_salina.2